MFKKINNYNVYLTSIMVILTIMSIWVWYFCVRSISSAFSKSDGSTLDLAIFINGIAFVVVYTISLAFLTPLLIKTQMGERFLINVNEDLQTIKIIQNFKNKLFIALSLSSIIILILIAGAIGILETYQPILSRRNITLQWISYILPTIFLSLIQNRFITSEYKLSRFIKSNIKGKRKDNSISFNELREMTSKLNKKLYGFSIYRYKKI